MQDKIKELRENVITDHQLDGITETGKKEPVTYGTEMGKQDYNNIRNTELVVAALIATVTFTAGLTLPGGYKSNEGPDQGRALLIRVAAFRTFVIANAFALVLSLRAIGVYSMSSLTKTKWELEKQFLWGSALLGHAMSAMMIAFLSGSYAVLMNSSSLAVGVIIVVISCSAVDYVVSFRYTKSAMITWIEWYFKREKKEESEGRKKVPNPYAFLFTLAIENARERLSEKGILV